jgi:hypothetical protein
LPTVYWSIRKRAQSIWLLAADDQVSGDCAAHFATITSHLIDDARCAVRENTDPAVRLQALRLKLGDVSDRMRTRWGRAQLMHQFRT